VNQSQREEQFLRPVEVHSHQFYMKGRFHRWVELDGKLHAVCESDSGDIDFFDLSYHSVKFLDRTP